jgi:hypothetical protein
VQPPPKHVLQRQIEQLIRPGVPAPSGGNTSAVLSGKSHVQHSGGPAAGGGAGGVQQQGQQQHAPQAGGTASAAGGDSAGGSSIGGGAVPGDADVAGWLVRCSVLLEKLSGGLMAAGEAWFHVSKFRCRCVCWVVVMYTVLCCAVSPTPRHIL